MPNTFHKISPEEKDAVMAAMRNYLDQNWSFNGAYNQVKADFQVEGKTVPADNTVRRWFAQAEPVSAPSDPAPAQSPSSPSSPSGPSIASPDIYTHRLELVIKLYRTRSEASCDAICDELLPELLTQEE